MKYIDSEKLIEGIKHIQSEFPVITYEALFHLIDSLQQEQPEVDFDEEFDKFHIGMYNPFDSGAEIREFAKHFFELGRNARKEE